MTTFDGVIISESDQCIQCYWYVGFLKGQGLVCFAYPEGIPAEIMDGTVDHRQPYLNDTGLRWRLDPDYAKILEDLENDSNIERGNITSI